MASLFNQFHTFLFQLSHKDVSYSSQDRTHTRKGILGKEVQADTHKSHHPYTESVTQVLIIHHPTTPFLKIL